MTIAAALQTGQAPLTSPDPMIAGSGNGANPRVSGTGAFAIAGQGSVDGVNPVDTASEPATFESSLNRSVESLHPRVDGSTRTERDRETIQFPPSFTAGKERISKSGSGIRALPQKQQGLLCLWGAAKQPIGGGVDLTAAKSPNTHQAQPAKHTEGVHRKLILCDADVTPGRTSGDGSPVSEIQNVAPVSMPNPAESGIGMNRGETRQTGESPDTGNDIVVAEVRTHGEKAQPGSLQPNLLNENVGASLETSHDGTKPIAGLHRDSRDPVEARPEQGFVEISEGRNFPETVQGAKMSARADGPVLSEPDSAALSISTGLAGTQNAFPAHLPARGGFNGTPVHYGPRRTAPGATPVNTPGESGDEKTFPGLAAQQEMETARLQNGSAVNGQAEQQASVATESVRSSLSVTNGPQGTDPFAALDADQVPRSAWVHAGAHLAEAGYLDPALGWVSVRAEATGHGIHAAVVPGSLEAAQVLGGHLAGLNAHLAEQHRNTATVTLASPQPGSGVTGWNAQTAGGGQGAGRDSTAQGGDTRETATAESLRVEQSNPVNPGSSKGTMNSLIPPRSGTYISVIA